MKIYKYCHPDRLDILKNLKIRFTYPSALNDPFEMKPHFKSIASEDHLKSTFDNAFDDHCKKLYQKLSIKIKSIISLEEFKNKLHDDIKSKNIDLISQIQSYTPSLIKSIDSELNKNIGVLCLTEDEKNMRMWSLYANSHKGFVLEFNHENIFFNRQKSNLDELRFLRKVDYVEDRPSLNIFGTDGIKFFLTKSKDWSYEKEWRMIMPLNEASEILSVEDELIHLFEIPGEAIKSIIFGCNMQNTKKNEIIQLIKNNNELNHIVVFQSEIDEQTFGLNFEKLCKI
jgi:hypothetical protein